VCTWCRLTCLFSWRTRPRCRKVSGQRAKSLEIRSLPVPSGFSFSSTIASSSSSAATPTFLIRLCLPLARWREEILEMRDSFIKGEKRCQRGRHHRVGRFDHTNYRDSSDATRSSLSVSLFLSFFLPRPERAFESSYDTFSWAIGARKVRAIERLTLCSIAFVQITMLYIVRIIILEWAIKSI